MPIIITGESELIVGTELVVEASAPEGDWVAIFEDDGETGYFYVLDTSREENPIEKALHIYNVASVSDKTKPSKIEIGWSRDNLKVILMINSHPHAVFDCEVHRGYCRTGFPSALNASPWAQHGHEWSDSVLDLFE